MACRMPRAGATRLSIVVVTHNSRSAVAAALPAVRDQLRPGDELLVVDNDSSDDTLAIISIAQQARPNVIGHRADFLAQFTTASRFVVMIFASNCRSRRLICSLSLSRPHE